MRVLTPLSRDTRDTLFLLATIAAVTLPHGDHLPLHTPLPVHHTLPVDSHR